MATTHVNIETYGGIKSFQPVKGWNAREITRLIRQEIGDSVGRNITSIETKITGEDRKVPTAITLITWSDGSMTTRRTHISGRDPR